MDLVNHTVATSGFTPADVLLIQQMLGRVASSCIVAPVPPPPARCVMHDISECPNAAWNGVEGQPCSTQCSSQWQVVCGGVKPVAATPVQQALPMRRQIGHAAHSGAPPPLPPQRHIPLTPPELKLTTSQQVANQQMQAMKRQQEMYQMTLQVNAKAAAESAAEAERQRQQRERQLLLQ